MFARVLVPLDGSPLAVRALNHVSALAQADAEVLLLRVIEPSTSDVVDPLEWRLRRDVAQMYVDQVAEDLRAHTSLRPRTLVLEGNPAAKILEVARDASVQLIAMSSHGAGGLNEWNLNSTAFKVAQRAGSSILLVRSYRLSPHDAEDGWAAEAYRRILIPLDGSLRSEHVLPAADRLATRQEATLVLSHVVMQQRSIQRLEGREDSDLQERALAEGVTRARGYLADVATGLSSKSDVEVLCDHDVAAALHHFADSADIDLVVLSAHGHSGQRCWPHGSLATSLLLHGGTPLLVLQDVPWEDLEPSRAELAARSAPAPPVHAGGAGAEESERMAHGLP